jgi:hypothetical protein
VYNPASNRMIVFGGCIGWGHQDTLNDLWVLTNADGTTGTPAWKKLDPVGTPPNTRCGHAAVLDQANNRMIVTGGQGPGSPFFETWVLVNADGTGGPPAWMRLQTNWPMPYFFYHSLGYDAANNRLIAQGGVNLLTGFNDGEVWALPNANGIGGAMDWIKLNPTNPRPRVQWQTSGYDPGTNTAISFIDNTDVSPHVNQVWLLKNANGLGGTPDWTELTPSGVLPPTRYGTSAVYDGSRNKMVIFGGCTGETGEVFLNDVWRLENANGQGGAPQWTPFSPDSPLPPVRNFHNMVYNPGTDRMILFGGSHFSPPNHIYFDDVWVLTEAMGPAPNSLPICNAGGSLHILSKDQSSTTLNGTASDPVGRSLKYRWLEGATELATWQPVQNDQAPLNLGPLLFFSLGQHSLTLEVKISDGDLTSRDSMILTVENSAPNAGPTGEGIYQVNAQVTLAGQVSDFDGDVLNYQWMEGTTVLNAGMVKGGQEGQPVSLPSYIISSLPVGDHQIILQVSDGVNAAASAGITVSVIDTTAPTLAPAASPTILWPPNHQMVPITITANASDNSGMPVTLTAQVSCNEPNDGSQYWTTPVIDQASGIITVQLQASRLGKGTGRNYVIDITATDQAGNTSSAKAVVTVPHDRGKN